MKPEDPHLADALGYVSEAKHEMMNARPLRALVAVDNAEVSLQAFVSAREDEQ